MIVFPFKEKNNLGLWDQTLFSKSMKKREDQGKTFFENL